MALIWTWIFVVPLFALATIVCGAFSIAASLSKKRGRVMMGAAARVWGGMLVKIAGVRITVEGLEKIDPNGAYVFASNHLSYMDTPVVLSQIPVQFRFMAKSGLFKIPFLGTHLAQAGHIPVPREDPRAAVRALALAGQTIRDHGISVLVFPEGGRAVDGKLQEFKEGAAYIAINAGVSVVPLALIGTREVLAMHTTIFHRGPVTLRVADPIPIEGLTMRDRKALTNKVREQIAAMLDQFHG
jgi:1-acyl-sn-glycerol-3-phosphate acyltransferase